MGMFDYIRFKVKCPLCGTLVQDFQSKDGQCLLETLEYWQVDNFYSYCNNCGNSIEYKLEERRKIPLKDYSVFIGGKSLKTPQKEWDK
jgi:hypothetical protein